MSQFKKLFDWSFQEKNQISLYVFKKKPNISVLYTFHYREFLEVSTFVNYLYNNWIHEKLRIGIIPGLDGLPKCPIICKLVVENQPIEQVISFYYLVEEKSANEDRKSKKGNQVDKVIKISEFYMIWEVWLASFEKQKHEQRSEIKTVQHFVSSLYSANLTNKNWTFMFQL